MSVILILYNLILWREPILQEGTVYTNTSMIILSLFTCIPKIKFSTKAQGRPFLNYRTTILLGHWNDY